jgi:hypothetical protein
VDRADDGLAALFDSRDALLKLKNMSVDLACSAGRIFSGGRESTALGCGLIMSVFAYEENSLEADVR